MKSAVKSLRPGSVGSLGHVLCDNESFLRAPASRAAYRAQGIKLWDMPPRSPDFNPVVKFRGWLKKRLRQMDLEDLKAKRPRLGKIAYRHRVRAVCRTRKAQKVAAACALGLRRVCREVVAKKGAMSRS